MQIRPRLADDLPAVERLADLIRRIDGYPGYLPGSLRDFLVTDDALGAWVAEQEEIIVGHVALHRRSWGEVMRVASESMGLEDGQLAVIARLFVIPEARQQGVGLHLLNSATAEAWRLGRRPILDVVANLAAAVRLYERAGWKIIGTVEFRHPDGRRLPEHVFAGPLPGSYRGSA
ncbi:MAG: GNAT family N-acetyltransferase [Acidimicrobiales bacterium]|nr:GNAT family N-acetyltransferase [Acidimicrobiales bacterium]